MVSYFLFEKAVQGLVFMEIIVINLVHKIVRSVDVALSVENAWDVYLDG